MNSAGDQPDWIHDSDANMFLWISAWSISSYSLLFCPSLNPSLSFMDLHTTWCIPRSWRELFMSQNVICHYLILPTFTTFANEFLFCCSFLSILLSIPHLTIQNSCLPSSFLFSLILFLLPPAHLWKYLTFIPPCLCIPPEGRLSSFPISSRSLLALSHSPVSLILSITCVLTCTEKDTPAETHTPLSFVNTVSSDGKKLPYLPTCRPLSLLYVKSHHTGVGSASALSITSNIKGSSQTYWVTRWWKPGTTRWKNVNLSRKPSLNLNPNHHNGFQMVKLD